MSTFRVIQFNLQFGQGWTDAEPHHGSVDLAATIAELRRHDADILLLQEVERAQPAGVQINPPPNYTQLRAAFDGYDGVFAYPKSDARELPFGIGLAILSRTPLRELSRLDLPSPPVPFRFEENALTPTDRLLISAQTSLYGREVTLFNTHLLAFFMLGTSSQAHPEQREIVQREVSQSNGATILGGDFNVRKHADLIAQFGAVGFRTAQDQAITWRRQPYVLDHIFYNAPLRLVNQQVIPTMTSDHHLLLADFEFSA
ncbi:MAG: endonuclease/exonuclease/phosphatase family protein [Opitutus sp.]